MGGRGILGLSPAQRMARLFSSSRGRHSDPDKVAAGPKPPADLPPFQREAKPPTNQKASLVAKSPQVCP